MLVLTRKLGESIRIGDDISVRVLDIQRGQVRVAIDAPRDVPVHREEIYALVRDENRDAAERTAQADPGSLWRGDRSRQGQGQGQGEES